MLIGASYIMLRSSYDSIGGFSPFFRTWGRLEQDLSLRAWVVGAGVKCVTDARVGHFSRKKFPYKVCWEDIEFNQLATVRTAFEESTSRRLEQLLQSPPQVKRWLDETEFDAWRESIQSRRVITDRDLFEKVRAGSSGRADGLGLAWHFQLTGDGIRDLGSVEPGFCRIDARGMRYSSPYNFRSFCFVWSSTLPVGGSPYRF